MLCPSCEIDMRIDGYRHEVVSRSPVAVELVQNLRCPRCDRRAEARHPLELTGPAQNR